MQSFNSDVVDEKNTSDNYLQTAESQMACCVNCVAPPETGATSAQVYFSQMITHISGIHVQMCLNV